MDDSQDEKKGYTGGEVAAIASVKSTPITTHHILAKENQLDSAAAFAVRVSLTEEDRKMILRKIDWRLLPFMCSLYMMQFLDKTTLGNSVLLGVKTANNLTTSEYNWLATVFYISYLAFEWPQSLGLQRFPVGKYMAANIICWAIFLMLHAACTNFAGLLIVRFLLGVCEGSVTSGFMIVTSQYYTSVEVGQRVGMWFLMNGTAQIFSGLLSYGIHHIYTDRIQQWQILYVLTGGLTFLLGVTWYFWFPDSPVSAEFLTPAERIMAIERIRENQTGIENKTWKKSQFVEALTDSKVWLFVAFSFFDNVPNALTNQNSTIYTELGFSTLTSTLLGIPGGVIEIVTIGFGVYLLGRFKNSRAIISILFFIPNLLGSILVVALPFSNKTGILVGLYITGFGTTGFVISLAWLQSTTSGHTKKTTAMFLNLCGYCLGNIVGPQLFQAQYAPRNTVPFSIILACYTICPIILLVIRQRLARENTRRDLLELRKKEDGMDNEEEFVDVTHSDGTTTVEKVEKRWRDLTDKENLEFRYCL